jgi:CheY-like chemotaxis protein
MKSLAFRAHDKGLEVATRVAAEVPDRLIGDLGRLRQVVINLVGNAIKFTERGEVVLEVELESQAEREVVLHFVVHDTGIGIPSDKATAIFGAFEQVGRFSTRRHGGTGLGLAICQRLVQLMGGRIWLESREGEGSHFHFTACLRTAVLQDRDGSGGGMELLSGTRVLVVDDNATNRKILGEMLRGWALEPVMASAASTAVDLLRDACREGHPFDLILSDVQMPEVDGLAMVQEIRRFEDLDSTLIIMLTSSDQPGDLQACERLGVSACLRKPVKQRELSEAITHCLLGEPFRKSRQTVAAKHRELPPLNVLLAEDSAVNQRLAVALLQKHRHQVTVVDNGRAAVDAVEGSAYDLVLMDVQMPDMDGLQATQAIRQRERDTGQHVPIVAMTAHALKGDREKCIQVGMDGYVAKPIRQDEFFGTIALVLQRLHATR